MRVADYYIIQQPIDWIMTGLDSGVMAGLIYSCSQAAGQGLGCLNISLAMPHSCMHESKCSSDIWSACFHALHGTVAVSMRSHYPVHARRLCVATHTFALLLVKMNSYGFDVLKERV